MGFIEKIKVDTLANIRKITVEQFGLLGYEDRMKILSLSPGIYEKLMNGERSMIEKQIKKYNSKVQVSDSRHGEADLAPYNKMRNS